MVSSVNSFFHSLTYSVDTFCSSIYYRKWCTEDATRDTEKYSRKESLFVVMVFCEMIHMMREMFYSMSHSVYGLICYIEDSFCQCFKSFSEKLGRFTEKSRCHTGISGSTRDSLCYCISPSMLHTLIGRRHVLIVELI